MRLCFGVRCSVGTDYLIKAKRVREALGSHRVSPAMFLPCVSPPCSVWVKPFCPLTLPAPVVTHMPGRGAGCRGQAQPAPSTGKGRSGGSVRPLTDDRGVRGSREGGGVEPVEPFLKHPLACYPSKRKAEGSPSANWYYQGAHHLGAKYREAQRHTCGRGVYEHVFICTCTCTNTTTHTSASLSVWWGALQPQGEAPASPPARPGQVEHLAPQKGHRRPAHPRPQCCQGSRRLHPYLFFSPFRPTSTVTRARGWTTDRHLHKVNPPRALISSACHSVAANSLYNLHYSFKPPKQFCLRLNPNSLDLEF